MSGGSTPAQLAAFLPLDDTVVVYVDAAVLRGSGILGTATGTKAAEEPDYRQFVEQTGFDYRDDLEAIAIAVRENPQTHQRDYFAAARGHFDWKRLISYAKAHGGECNASFCRVPASQPHRYVSFYPISTRIMAFASSSDQWGALWVARRPGAAMAGSVPAQPLWVLFSPPALEADNLLPEGAHAFALALKGARRVALTADENNGQLVLTLNASCASVDDASALAVRLEQLTETLRKWIAREHQKANPRDLSGILTAGSFRRDGDRVVGTWPIPPEFIQSVTGQDGQ